MALTKTDLKLIGKQTKDIVHEVLTDFYKDLFKVEFASKKDLQKFKIELKEKFATKKEIQGFKNEVLNGQDKILKELKDMRDEHTALHYRVHDKHQPQLEDHDRRISTLEVVVAL